MSTAITRRIETWLHRKLDAVLFLGDYIYEYHLGHNQARKHDLAHIISLEDYWHQHAQYKTDADLQACHAAHLWIVTFNDHEVENNWAGIYPEWSHPQPDFRARRAAAFQRTEKYAAAPFVVAAR